MKTILILSLFFISTFTFAQSEMSVKNDFWSGQAIYQNGEKISIAKAMEIGKNNAEVVEKLSKARTNRTLGNILAYPGSIAFGYTLGLSLNNNTNAPEPNWTVGGIGAAMMVGGMVLQGNGNKKLREAVNLYNEIISKKTSSIHPEFSLTYSENGLGLRMNF